MTFRGPARRYEPATDATDYLVGAIERMARQRPTGGGGGVPRMTSVSFDDQFPKSDTYERNRELLVGDESNAGDPRSDVTMRPEYRNLPDQPSLADRMEGMMPRGPVPMSRDEINAMRAARRDGLDREEYIASAQRSEGLTAGADSDEMRFRGLMNIPGMTRRQASRLAFGRENAVPPSEAEVQGGMRQALAEVLRKQDLESLTRAIEMGNNPSAVPAALTSRILGLDRSTAGYGAAPAAAPDGAVAPAGGRPRSFVGGAPGRPLPPPEDTPELDAVAVQAAAAEEEDGKAAALVLQLKRQGMTPEQIREELKARGY